MDGTLYFDVELATEIVSKVSTLARAADGMGVGAVWANEIRHDPFVQLALAAANSRRVRLGTAIALAFTRSPMTLAYASWDIQNLSRGRLILGLGSQVKGHIERRFGMKWEPPVARMREVILTLRSIWSAWQTGERLEFEGRFYKINLMTPFFDPGPIEHPKIPIFLAGVNSRMCALAGELFELLDHSRRSPPRKRPTPVAWPPSSRASMPIRINALRRCRRIDVLRARRDRRRMFPLSRSFPTPARSNSTSHSARCTTGRRSPMERRSRRARCS